MVAHSKRYNHAMNDKTQQALIRAVYKVLRPMVRLLVRHGVSYRSFSDIARRAFIDVAEQDFALEKRKASNSRTAVLTGINRKDIAKIKERPHPLQCTVTEPPNATARIITAWLNDPKYRTEDGRAKVLPVEAPLGATSFTQLVHEHSTDVTVRALLDELTRLGACEKNDNNLRLLVNGYIPIADMNETLRIFGTAASDLISTMDHNIARLSATTFLQRTVSYDDIPAELLNSIRARCNKEGDQFLLQVNDWLATQDRNENKNLIGSGRFRAGIGIYYIEHAVEGNNNEDCNE